eukprot:198162-Pyramimonas_sp.AAC.1
MSRAAASSPLFSPSGPGWPVLVGRGGTPAGTAMSWRSASTSAAAARLAGAVGYTREDCWSRM